MPLQRDLGVLQRRLHLDGPLLTGLLLLSCAGLVVLYSASNESLATLRGQLIRLGIAFVIMVAVAQVSPERMRRWAPIVFLAGLLALLLVPLIGLTGKGAQRWLEVAGVRFQPSELMKLVLPMMIAWLLSRQTLPPHWTQVLLALVVIAVPSGLIVAQPDLGTGILVISSGLFVLFLAGLRWRWIIAAALGLLALVPVFWHFLMYDYQRTRVLTLFDPSRDPLGSGYHIIQSSIAIGSGGLLGKGWLNSTQARLEFLPERNTDFIFAVFSEEFGLVGALLLLLLYLTIILRGLYIAVQAQDSFGRLLGGSLALTFSVYVIVNIGMVSGVLPVVGLPLPLISYGGTSMVTILAGFGILMSIHTHRRLWSS